MKSMQRACAALSAAAMLSFAIPSQAADTLAPNVPQFMGAVSRTCNSIDLTWFGGFEPEMDEVQSGLARFEIRAASSNARVFSGPGNSGSSPWSYLRTPTGLPLRFARITGLVPGAAYEFNITALDNAGNRSGVGQFPIATVLSSGAACTDITPPPVPDIQASTFTPHDCNTLVSRIAESTDEGSGIEGYFVYLDNLRAGFSTTTYPYLPPLVPGRTYRVSLQAVDKAGNASAISAQTAVTMPACTSRVSGLQNVYAQAFYFKGEPVPSYDRLTAMQNILHDFDGTNVANPLNVDRYLRETSFGALGLKKPTVLSGWTQLPRTADEYGCVLIDGRYGNCNIAAINTDAINAHPLRDTLERVFALRMYFVDRFLGGQYSMTGRSFILTGIEADLERTSIQASTMVRNSLMRFNSAAIALRCPGPGSAAPSGAGNAPVYSQDLSFGCFHGATDFSVTPDLEGRRMPHPPMLWKYWFGWLADSEVRRVTHPFSGVLGAADRTSTISNKLLLVPVAPIGTSANANTPYYTLELITGAGLNAGQTRGLAIRYVGNVLPQSTANAVKYIDTLESGESFVDPYRGIRIELTRTVGAVGLVRTCNTTPGVAADGSFSSACVN